MIDVADIVEDIVAQMDVTIQGRYDLATDRTYVCSTKWIRKGMIVRDELGENYRILLFEPDLWVFAVPLIPAIPPAVKRLQGRIFLPDPVFMTGTKLATNREWTLRGTNLLNKLPLIWLLEVISEVGYGRESVIERDMELRLFFLDETDPQQYYTKDHRREVVQPMEGLMEEFVNTVERLQTYKPLANWRYRTFSRFGTEAENGMLQNILDANLSGVSLEISISRYKEKNCNC
jgi:hypothetical protein